MFLIFVVSYVFYQFSPALCERSKALFTNPAGLAFKPGFELYYNAFEKVNPFTNESKFNHDFALSVGGAGFSYRIIDKTRIYSFGFGVPVGQKLGIGYTYTKNKESSFFTLGIMIRPWSFLSIGAKGDFYKDGSEYLLGIGLKPLTNRITVSGDLKIKKNTIDYYYITSGIEIIDGLVFTFHLETPRTLYRELTKYFLGIEVSFGKTLISSSVEKERNLRNYSIILSKEIYPRFFKLENKWLEIRLKGVYPEERSRKGFPGFETKPSFYDLLKVIKKAEKDREVEGVILYFESPSFYPAQAEELREEILELKEKKYVIAYAENLSERNYYIASACDKIILPNEGYVILKGPYMEVPYLKKFFEKTGIVAQLERVGKYKSAVEPLIRENMSKEDREQRELYLKRLLEKEIDEISSSRGIDKDSLRKLMEREAYFNSEKALKYGLVDTVAFESDIPDLIEKWYKKKPKKISQKKWVSRKFIRRDFVDTRPKIALVIAEGGIVTGESGRNPFPLIGGKMLGSSTMQRILSKIEKDKSVKAVVIRVNSPGGDALASEIIWNAIRRLKRKKPVIVSMGGVAASGGYYISCPADYIFADYTTITGSIGILGGKLALGSMFEKIGITFDVVKLMKHSDAFSLIRPFDNEEIEKLKDELMWGYKNFVRRVAASRNLSESYVDSIGQGRIWSGYDGKQVKIVDEIGGIFDAIEKAKELANIEGDVRIVIYPKKELLKMFYPSDITLKSPLKSLIERGYIYYEPVKLK